MIGHDMRQQPALEDLPILQELDLGWHILLLLSDGSIDLVTHGEQTPDLAWRGLHLDSDETYRLFISLYEQFKQQDIRQNE